MEKNGTNPDWINKLQKDEYALQIPNQKTGKTETYQLTKRIRGKKVRTSRTNPHWYVIFFIEQYSTNIVKDKNNKYSLFREWIDFNDLNEVIANFQVINLQRESYSYCVKKIKEIDYSYEPLNSLIIMGISLPNDSEENIKNLSNNIIDSFLNILSFTYNVGFKLKSEYTIFEKIVDEDYPIHLTYKDHVLNLKKNGITTEYYFDYFVYMSHDDIYRTIGTIPDSRKGTEAKLITILKKNFPREFITNLIKFGEFSSDKKDRLHFPLRLYRYSLYQDELDIKFLYGYIALEFLFDTGKKGHLLSDEFIEEIIKLGNNKYTIDEKNNDRLRSQLKNIHAKGKIDRMVNYLKDRVDYEEDYLKKIIKSLNDTRGKIAHREFKATKVIEDYLILKDILNQVFRYEIDI